MHCSSVVKHVHCMRRFLKKFLLNVYAECAICRWWLYGSRQRVTLGCAEIETDNRCSIKTKTPTESARNIKVIRHCQTPAKENCSPQLKCCSAGWHWVSSLEIYVAKKGRNYMEMLHGLAEYITHSLKKKNYLTAIDRVAFPPVFYAINCGEH